MSRSADILGVRGDLRRVDADGPTYDRRGFGHSGKPSEGYDYDTWADGLAAIIDELDLQGVSLVGFSMGGGEVAATSTGTARTGCLASCPPPPFLAQSDDNPDGPLDQATADEMEGGLRADRDSFFPDFVSKFSSVDGTL